MIHTPIYVILSLILPVISLPDQLHHRVIMHEVVVLDKKQGFPHCQVVVPRVASLPNIGPDRSVMLPGVVNLDRSACSPGEDICGKNNKKSFTICTVTKDVETSKLLHTPALYRPTGVKVMNPTAMRSRLH